MSGDGGENLLIEGDNLAAAQGLPPESIDLIYVDPPFCSGRTHRAGETKQNEFSDVWADGLQGYLRWLMERLDAMKRLLKNTGSLVVHCDHHASHYIKVELDGLFGMDHFVNEVVWCYKSGGASPRRHFSRKHDVLLVYAKSDDYYFQPQKEKSYNRGLRPYRFAGVEEFEDELGWYTVVGMKDYWEIDMVGRTSAERLGYPTQKPEKLLERVVAGLSPEDGVVADFFCGSGTTAAVAHRLGRSWVACDESEAAVRMTAKRLAGAGAAFRVEKLAVSSGEAGFDEGRRESG